ncbi:TetR/AcrR family transcriptional regulator [Amycolatopsis sp. Poz14]|uniref:TetR/AcrR family transcriptional regulator n=1 Tax=Amycolatopsis sp. Poz14 TaxID=1447705 RepID=UPI001EE7FBC4|nr:TetR family transcriptional regulator [Amycolatopsis sp. Poz14]MCG3754769.1 TetR family transcriptional regulator [Amycolatopsis sp. Poz14]
MTVRSPLTKAKLSPNQLEKQRQIIEAARVVLARDGLAACTTRAVEEAGPLAKSAIHYYFSDMDELVDQAMAQHLQAFMDRLRAAAAAHEDPSRRFWAAVEEFLGIFAQMPSTALLWFDYWIDATRKGRVEPIDRLNREVTAIYEELLAAVPVPEPQLHAEALFSCLLGLIVRQTVQGPIDALRPLISQICAVDVPS